MITEHVTLVVSCDHDSHPKPPTAEFIGRCWSEARAAARAAHWQIDPIADRVLCPQCAQEVQA